MIAHRRFYEYIGSKWIIKIWTVVAAYTILHYLMPFRHI